MLIHSIVSPDLLLSVPEGPIRSLHPWGSGWLEGYEGADSSAFSESFPRTLRII